MADKKITALTDLSTGIASADLFHVSNTTTISFISGAATILGDGTVDGQLKIIAATGVATTTDVDFIDSAGTTATVTFQAVGESVSCIYDGTGSKWHIIAYGATGTGNNIVGTQDVT
jgi:hypothetical protein